MNEPAVPVAPVRSIIALFLVAVIPVVAFRQHAAWRYRGDECVGNWNASERSFETGNVTGDGRVADIFDRSGHGPASRAPVVAAKEYASLIVFGVELSEIAPVLAVNGRERFSPGESSRCFSPDTRSIV